MNSGPGDHHVGVSLMIFSISFWTFIDKEYFKTSRGRNELWSKFLRAESDNFFWFRISRDRSELWSRWSSQR